MGLRWDYQKVQRGDQIDVKRRRINVICSCCANRRKQIDADLVREAAADLDIGPLANQRRLEPLPVVRSIPAARAAPDLVPSTLVPIFSVAKTKSRFGRVAVFAPILVLGVLGAALDRDDIKAAAAQTRRTLVAAAASLSSHASAVKADPAGTPAAPGQDLGAGTPALTDLDTAVATPTPTPRNSEDATSLASAPPSLALARQAGHPVTTPIKPMTLRQAESSGETTTVIVQPHDDLRKICLQYLGSFSEHLLTKISKLNPELTNPDHIAIGQRIVLPRLPENKPHDLTASPRPTP